MGAVSVVGTGEEWLALWPFQSLAQVQAWQVHRELAGGDPQHRLDPAATALEFTRGALGYTGVDLVTSSVAGQDGGQLVSVGWLVESGAPLTVATLRLVPLGAGSQAPWVVTGTVHTGLLDPPVFTWPAYGATVRAPLEVGGVINGVDEALRVVVVGPDGRRLGAAGPIGLGGRGQPWRASVPLTGAVPGLLVTVAVSTGGHLGDVEWFAVTAARLA
jgi:hypothetical protein